MKRTAIAIILVLICSCIASAGDVETWHDPSFRVNEQKKIFILPARADLNAQESLAPKRQQESQINEWLIEAVRSGMKRRGTTIIKPLNELIDDMRFIYSDTDPQTQNFFSHASEMGYTAFIRTSIWQEFRTEHVPEEIRTYTVYREVERRDRYGRLIEVLKIPEEKTEVIPAHDVTYLYTACQPEIYSVEEFDGDYKAVVVYKIYREYQGGNVMGVIENIIKASMKELFNQPEAKSKSSKRDLRPSSVTRPEPK